ncbi:MAG: hypothetical protein PUD34_01460 [bacterium]|nr:hypothetical protein [bacterium]
MKESGQMKKRVTKLLLIITLFLICIFGVSYAYYLMSNKQEDDNIAKSSCFQLAFTSQKNEINLDNMYPISDEEGKVLTPFSFTITNTCDMIASYNVNLEMLEGTTMNSDYVAVMVNDEAPSLLSSYDSTNVEISGSVESRTLAKGTLSYNDSVDYKVRFWMDKSVTSSDSMNKNFLSKIVITASPSVYNPKDAGYNTLHDAILANEYQTTPDKALEKINGKNSPYITTDENGVAKITNTAPVIKWMEKTEETSQTRTVVKIAESAINSDDATSDLTVNDTKMQVYTMKTFNSETGRYTLSDMQYVDPSTLTFGGDIHYYYSTEGIEYNTATKKLYTATNNGDIKICEIISAIATNTKTKWNSVEYASNTYNLTINELTVIELESDKSDKGLYAGVDDYGTTYYYRGNVKNNNVLFAGYYWQIVRINGDGSIRLIYNGSKANATGTAQSINTRNYQFNSKYNEPAYVGYMYGDADAGTFNEVHANTNDSTIKTAVDSWYKTNIADKEYSSYISTAVGFCGDRSLYSNSGGNGIQTDKDTRFAPYGRYASDTATFNCANTDRDMYTVTNSDGETRTVDGNQALTYPVGLVTYDELVFAGMDVKHLNKLNWTYSSNHYWTMSPSHFYAWDGRAREWFQLSNGYLSLWYGVTLSNGVRPVINLKSDVKISGGIGTPENPYVIETNGGIK